MTITPRQIKVGAEYGYTDLAERDLGFMVKVTGITGYDKQDRVEYGIIYYGKYARLSPRSASVQRFCERASTVGDSRTDTTSLAIPLVIAAVVIYWLFIR